MRRYRLILASAVTVSVSALIAFVFSQEQSPWAVYDDQENFEKLAKFYEVLESNYFEDIEENRLFSSMVNGMLNRLDPHSVFIDYADYARREEQYRGNYYGIGVSFVMLDDKITVVEVFAGGPSDRAGLKMGDMIVEIEGDRAIGIENTEVQRLLRGPEGSQVSVKIERPHHEELIPVTITRGEIKIASVENVLMLDSETGYIRISRFAVPTSLELEQAMVELERRGMKQMVLDLRSNTGGLLEPAIRISDKFLPGRRLVVYTDGRQLHSKYPFYSMSDNRYWDLPLVVLIDHSSASASEIVAGALQDWDRAVIVGETSFGKGLVQTNYILEDRSRLMLTTARYYTPSGRLIQRNYQGVDIDTYQLEGLFDNDQGNGSPDDDISDRPQFLTAAGRPVYGGGGITPDEIVSGEAIFDRMVYSFNYRLNVFLFARDYYWSKPQLAEQYEEFRISHDNYDMQLRKRLLDQFNADFEVTDDMLAELFKYVKGREFVYYSTRGEQFTDEELEKQYWELADQFRLYLKSEIAQFSFGRSAAYHLRRAVSNRDKQINTARRLFDKAAELAENQTNIEPDVFAHRRASGESNE